MNGFRQYVPMSRESETSRLDAFPIMEVGARRAKDDLTSIPWRLIAPHDATAQRNHGGQNLIRLAQRGGLCPLEAVAVLEDVEYRKRWPDTYDRGIIEKRTLEARAILKQMVAKLALVAILMFSGCAVIRIHNDDGVKRTTATCYVPAWPWQDSKQIIDRLALQSKTNGVFTLGLKSDTEQTANTNVIAMIESIVQASVSAAVKAALIP